MRLTIDEVGRIASLAGLRVGPEEARRLVPQMREIVRFVEEMGEPEGARDGKELASALPVREAEDTVRPGLDRETVLANAPDRQEGRDGGDGLIRVPPVRPERDAARDREER